MPAKLYDRSSGKWVDVRDEDVGALVTGGSHAFEKGVEVPVVSSDGEIGTVPSEKAAEAFKSGSFRWSTPQDVRAFEHNENEKILNERSSSSLDAFASGVSRGGTFGLADVIVPAAVGLLGNEGDEAFAKDALNRQRDINPGAAIAGEVVGSLIGGPAIAVKAAKGAGLIASEIQGGSALSRIARTAGQQAQEGLVYGLGQGISEAALGDPAEVAENLASSVAMGGLFGGAFGGLFGAGKEIAPAAKAFVSKTTQTVDETFRAQTRKAVSSLADKVLKNKEDAKVFRELLQDDDIARMIENGDDADFFKLKDTYLESQKALEKEAQDLRKGFDSYLSTEPKRIRDYINDVVLPQADGDIQAAVNNLDNEILANANQIESALRETGQLASDGLESHFGRTLDLTTALRKTGNSKAVKLANSIEATINAEKAAKGIRADEVFVPRAQRKARGLVDLPTGESLSPFTAVDERRILLDARKAAMEAAGGKTSVDKVSKLLNSYVDDVTKTIHGNEAFGIAQRKLDDFSQSYDSMRKFLTGTSKFAEKNVKQSVLNSLLTDQRQARQYNKVMTNIAEIAPEMEAFRKAGRDAVAKQNALEALQNKLDSLQDANSAIGERLSLGDYEKFLTALDAPADFMSRLERLKKLQTTLQATSTNPATNMIAVLKTLGHPVSELQEKILSKGELFEKLEKSFGKRHDPGMVEKLLGLAIKRPIRGLAGAAIGGYFGDTTGAILGTAAAGVINPRFVLKNIARLERASQQAAERATKATSAAIDALTSSKAKGIQKAVLLNYGNSLKERRKTFKERSAYTTAMANDPDQLAAEFENRFGETQHTPAVSGAMMAQFAKTAQFLDSKMPKDPLAGRYLSVNHSKWQPSDFQLSQYERYVRAAEDPISVIEDLSRGKVTPEAVEALKTLNPTMFKQLQQGVTDAIMSPEADPTYKQKLMIGTLLGIPADPTLTADFIGAMQATYQEQAQTGQSQPATAPQKSVHIDINPQAIATETQRISYA